MSDVSGEFAENCGFEGKVLCEVSQPCAPCDSRDTCDTTTSEQLAEIEGQGDEVRVREGRWKTRAGEIVSVSAMPTDDDNFSPAYPWWDGDVATWADDGVFFSGYTADKDLVEYLGPIEPEPQPQPEPPMLQDADDRIRLLKQANDAQAETIGRLQGEARDLNMEIGGLQQELQGRHARIRDLETLHAAATQAVVDAGKANDKLRAQVDELRSEVSFVQNLLGEARAELAGAIQSRDAFAAANREQADKTLREQLQLANDKLAQLEVLQPMAAACHTAQTMVRDMLGHMRCLLALHHTTDRSNFCMLLESILEVFDEAECDEDEAGQG